jgi:glutathione peroxidase
MPLFDHSFIDNNNKIVHMSDFEDKTLMLVNVASRCGFTKQYEWLQYLHEKYADQGLVVIGFPCNQFGEQEPGTDEEIKDFCRTNYNVTFTISKKIDVSGDYAHPIYLDLVAESGLKEVPWNFTKFIVSKGDVVATGPDDTIDQLEALIKKSLGD